MPGHGVVQIVEPVACKIKMRIALKTRQDKVGPRCCSDSNAGTTLLLAFRVYDKLARSKASPISTSR